MESIKSRMPLSMHNGVVKSVRTEYYKQQNWQMARQDVSAVYSSFLTISGQ